MPRWVIVPHIRPQSVAEHSFRVAVLAGRLARFMGQAGWTATLDGLRHDAEEAASGDIPTPFKKRRNWVGPSEPNSIINCADKIEAIIYIRRWGIGPLAKSAADSIEKSLVTSITDPKLRQAVDEVYAWVIDLGL